MAPRRGGSGGGGDSSGGGSSSPVCPGFLAEELGLSTPIVYYVSYCLTFFLTLVTFISLCCIRKRAMKLNALLAATLSFMTLAWALVIIGITIRECHVGDSYNYYRFAIAFDIFFYIGQFLLLVIAVWGVNSLLSKRLASGEGAIQAISIAIVGLMGALTAGILGLDAYNTYQLTPEASNRDLDFSKMDDQQRFAVAYWALYLVSVLAGGALSVAMLLKLRSRNNLTSDITKRVVILIFLMVMWVIFQLIPAATTEQDKFLSQTTYTALYYLTNLFQVFSYVAVILLIRLETWTTGTAPQTAYDATGYTNQSAFVPTGPAQNQYGVNGQPISQYNWDTSGHKA